MESSIQKPPTISLRSNIWIVIPIGALILAIVTANLLLLNYVHVVYKEISHKINKEEEQLFARKVPYGEEMKKESNIGVSLLFSFLLLLLFLLCYYQNMLQLTIV